MHLGVWPARFNSLYMFDTMQALYDELWGKQLSVIEPHTFSISQPQHGLHPRYMVDLKEIDDEAFPDKEFEKGKEEQVFQVLEFEAIERELVEIESEKWTDVDPKTEMPAVGFNLDYQIAGQPGSVLRILKGQPTVFRFNDHLCYMFDSDSKGSETNAYSLFHLPENQKKELRILTDRALEDEG
ncbi:hypothetical protein L873DRAFT_1788851 [Choiromyces venosus 120613-1]|uniref:Uncharacterized protein n=1 Tax=Choiromyces venosus 120613-1 TaxID=1336337 RepID=A0A3N4JQS2_9PEZI|nr:hypothetical protein L873DRAFT_1788851 [Choiromyces venosus 120613-1]